MFLNKLLAEEMALQKARSQELLGDIGSFLKESFRLEVSDDTVIDKNKIPTNTLQPKEIEQIRKYLIKDTLLQKDILNLAGIISKVFLEGEHKIFSLVELLLQNKKVSFMTLDSMSKHNVFHPVLRQMTEKLKANLDSKPLEKFIEILSESNSVLYVDRFLSQENSLKVSGLKDSDKKYLREALKKGYELGVVRGDEILLSDGSAFYLPTVKNLSKHVYVKRNGSNLAALYDKKLNPIDLPRLDGEIYFKNNKGIITAHIYEKGDKKVYSAQRFSNFENANAVLRPEGYYVPFSKNDGVTYLIYKENKILVHQEGERLRSACVKGLSSEKWLEQIDHGFMSLKYQENNLHSDWLHFREGHDGVNFSIWGSISLLASSFSTLIASAGLSFFLGSMVVSMVVSFFIHTLTMELGDFNPRNLAVDLWRRYVDKKIDKQRQRAINFYYEYNSRNQ